MNQLDPRPLSGLKKRYKRITLTPHNLTFALILAVSVGIGALVSCGSSATDAPAITPTATLVATFTPTVVSAVETATSTDATDAAPTATQTPAGATSLESPLPTPLSGTASAEVTPSETPPPGGVPEPTPTLPQPSSGMVKMKSPDYGMQAFLWWRPEVAQRDLEMVRDAGFGWVKQGFAWREIEGTGKGQFDWDVTDRLVAQVENVGGLHLIARLDNDPTWATGQAYPNNQNIIMSPPQNLQDFADYCGAVATRYKGRIAAYQVWNEPNLRREWGGSAPNPAGYVELLKTCYGAIKQADPDASVISAGLAPTTRSDNVAMPDTEFLRQMYAAGAQQYFDVLGAHGAGYKSPPEKDPGEVAADPNFHNRGDPNCPGDPCRIYSFRHIEDLRQIMVDHGDSDKQVAVLEFGWTIDERPDSPYAWHAVTEEEQADYFVRAYQYAKEHWQPWIGVMSLIYMPSVEWTEQDEQYWWSIALPNYPQFYPRKAYRDLAVMEK